VALDTLVPGQTGGRLCPVRLAWLDARLAEAPTRPTIILQHHPPFHTGISFMDDYPFDGIDGELPVLDRHPHVERVLCGHLHRLISRRVARTIAMTCASTTRQLKLDLRTPGGAALVPEPPVCLLHLYAGELVTHTSFIDSFGPVHVLATAGP